MASFDVLSKVDPQTVENAINVARKEIINRYDFHGSKTDIDFNKKELSIHITTENEMRVETIIDIIIARGAKQGIDPRSYDVSKEHYASGPMVKKDVKLRNGLDAEAIKKVIKVIKDTSTKVQPQKMDNIVRVSGKKIDELQEVIAALRRADVGFPLQFENMKS
jgi:cyclic-di-GMP-binding protein